MRKMVLTCVAALAVAAPAQADSGGSKGRELRITGTVVRASSSAISVENAVGDAVLTCAVPERLAQTAAAFKVGDRVRMFCVRYRGRRAQLLKLQRSEERAKQPETPAEEKLTAAGPIVELAPNAIVVQSPERRLACRVPEEKRATLDGLRMGDKVRIACAGGMLVALERYDPSEKPKPAGEEARMLGVITALSRASVTVQGETGSLTCSVPGGWAEKLATRFAVGDRVKLMCRGSELTALEKTA